MGNFQDLKKLVPIDAAGFMVPRQDRLGTRTQHMRWRTCTHSAADLEEKRFLRPLPTSVAARNGFVARIRSSGTTAAAQSSKLLARLGPLAPILYRLKVESVVWR